MERLGAALGSTLRIGAALLVVLVGVTSFSVATGAGRFTSYAGRSGPAATLMLATGTALVVAGLAISHGLRVPLAGDLALLAGLTWLAAPLVGWVEGPPLVRSVAFLVAGFTLPLVLHLLVALAPPSGPVVRTVVAVAYSEVALVGLGLALFRDPYLDPGCFANCTVNPFLVRPLPGVVSVVADVHRWFLAGAGGFLAGLAIYRAARGPRAARPQAWLVGLPSALFGIVVVAQTLVGLGHRGEDPFDPVLFGLYVALATALSLLAAGLFVAVALVRRRRRALSHLTSVLAGIPAPGDVAAALGEAVGDPDLRLAYRVGGSGLLVDAGGKPLSQSSLGNGRRTTSLTRNGVVVAVVEHSTSLVHLEEQLGSAVLLGLENERLQAEVLARLEQLRSSRERIVEAGDLERRRLERDLHDGAQQSLLALSYDVRLARAAAAAEGDTQTESRLRRATQLTQGALQDLRELAHGIFPSVLVEVGLVGALLGFADLAAIPVQVRAGDLDRQPGPVEAAAYFGVVEAVEDAARRGATCVHVTAEQDRGRLVVQVDDDGTPRTSPLIEVVDRVGALGGSTILGLTACRLEIPCG
ncbi:MAG: histidine kinase [Nostocoides sp.]